jgi:hypothetical protein
VFVGLRAQWARARSFPARWTTPTLKRARVILAVAVVVLAWLGGFFGDDPPNPLFILAGIALWMLQAVHRTYRGRFPAPPPATRVPGTRL